MECIGHDNNISVLSILPTYFGLEGISKGGAGFLTIVDRLVKLVFYYGHERAWFSSNFGVVKPNKKED